MREFELAFSAAVPLINTGCQQTYWNGQEDVSRLGHTKSRGEEEGGLAHQS